MSRIACLLVCASLGVTACASQTEDDLGQLDLSLSGTAASGAIYRLRDAQLTIMGSGPVIVIDTEENPDRTVIERELDTGSYTVSVSPSWRLERIATDGSITTVQAAMVSPNPQGFFITPGGFTSVALQFQTAGEVVTLARGRVGISLGVTELFSISGEVQGAASGLVLQNNAIEALVLGNGGFRFPTALPTGASYSVVVAQPPPGQVCTVQNGSGLVSTSDVTNVLVVCTNIEFTPFPVVIDSSGFGFGDLAVDGSGNLLVARPVAPGIVRVDRDNGAQSIVAENFAPATAMGVAYDPSTDTIYASTSDQIFKIGPDGTPVLLAATSALRAIAIPPAQSVLSGFLIGVTSSGLITATDLVTGSTGSFAGTADEFSDLAFAPDGTLYVIGNQSIYRLTPDGGFTLFFSFPITPGALRGITITPDGQRLFVADAATNAIFQVFINTATFAGFAFADIADNGVVQGIVAAPGNRLYVVTGQGEQRVIELPY